MLKCCLVFPSCDMPYGKNIYKLPSGMSYIAVGCEFYVKESTQYITYGVFKQKHTYNKVTY